MRIPHIATIGFMGLLVVLAIGCSRMTAPEEAELRKSFGLPADMPMRDLGVVKLRAGMPKRVRVGWNRDCTMTVTVLTNGLVQMNLLYESKGEVIGGVKTESHSERSQLVFHPGIRGRLCLPTMGKHLVVAMEPIIIP